MPTYEENWIAIGLGILVISVVLPSYIAGIPGLLTTLMFWVGIGIMVYYGWRRTVQDHAFLQDKDEDT